MQIANLSFFQLEKYLNLLTSSNLLEEKNYRKREYKTTEKGKEFISLYEEIESILNFSDNKL